MKTYNWEGVNPDGYFLDKLEPIPSALPSCQKLFQVSAAALSFFFQAEDGIRDLQGDWSSDVCSSDLVVPGQDAQQLCRVGHGARYRTRGVLVGGDRHDPRPADEPDGRFDADQQVCTRRAEDRAEIGRASCRERV